MDSPRVAAIVPAAGSGERLGAGVPKAMVPLAGVPLLGRAVRALTSDPRITLVVVAAPPGLESDMARTATDHAGAARVHVVTGGSTRAASVAAALAVLDDTVDVVLVHDAARCLVPTAVVRRVVDAVRDGAVAVIPGLAVVDTIREVAPDGGGSRTLDRSRLRAVQTPQGFAAATLRRAHAVGDLAATDDAGMVEALGEQVAIVDGDPLALKVTTPLDMVLAEALLARSAADGTHIPGQPPVAGPARTQEGP